MNPYTVDETHGAAAYVEFTVAAGQSVQCVQVPFPARWRAATGT